MLNFSTEIPVDPRNSIDDVLALAIEWASGSPHAKISADALRGFSKDTENHYTFEGSDGATTEITIIQTAVESLEIGAMKHVRLEASGLEWTSTMVATKSASGLVIGFQVMCEAMNTAVHLPSPKKPYFIRQTIERLGGGMDGEIPVADKPFYLTNGEESVAAALI